MLIKIKKVLDKEALKRENLEKNSKFLKSGQYIMHDSRKFAYLKNYAENRRSVKILADDQLIKSPSLLKRLFMKIVKNRITISNRSKSFKGTVYFFTSNHSKDRIFDTESNRVKVIFGEKEEKEKYLNTYKYFNNHFKLPAILTEGEFYLIEELVDNMDDMSVTVTMYKSILKDFIEYYKETAASIQYTTSHIMLEELKEIDDFMFFDSLIGSSLKSVKRTLVQGHGDLRKDNILISKSTGETFYIDWDLSKYYTHHYDLFFLIYYQAKNQDYELLDHYLKGHFDNYFIEGFSIFNEEFKISRRQDYYYQFMLEHYTQKVNQDHEVKALYESIVKYISKNHL